MIIPVDEIVYIVNCFEADNQFDVEKNAKVYQDKIAKVRAWLVECGCGTTMRAVDLRDSAPSQALSTLDSLAQSDTNSPANH